MKRLLIIFLIALWAISCNTDSNSNQHQHESHASESESTEKKPSLSPHTSAMAMIGDAHVHIDYSSPRVRDRIIWGGLVAYDNVWVTGAHNATWIQTNKDLMINGNHLNAGKYAIFTIPGKEEWTVIINKNWEQHGKDEYDQADDVMRFTVIPELLEESKEELTFEVVDSGNNKGTISMTWEKVRISFPFEVHL
ncbi:MAG: DUF2911 domain-containing protein [Bacteroidia bacterium]